MSKFKKMQFIFTSLMASTMIATSIVPTINVYANEEKTQVHTSTKRNVMYYGDWSIWGGQGNFYPKDIPADQLTHLNFAFLDFDQNGDLQFTDKDAAVGAPVGQSGVQWGGANAGILIAIQELRALNPNMKIGVSLGGWSKSADFSLVARDANKRENFINNILKFIEYTNMDFVDVDWEYPAFVREADLVDNRNDEGTPHSIPEDKENYIILLQELKIALNKQGALLNKNYELSVALPADKAKTDLGLDIDALFDVVDFANVMTYDMRGAWDEYSGHQTGLYNNPNDVYHGNNLSIDESVNYLLSKGAEAEKIVVGVAYYTRGWNTVEKGDNPQLPGLFQKATKDAKDSDATPSFGAKNEAPLTIGDGGRATGVWSYRSLDKLKANFPGIKQYWDDIAKAPFLYDETTGSFFTFDNIYSVKAKGQYVLDNQLGGLIGWMSSQDAPTTNGSVRDELTKTSKQALFGKNQLPQHEVVYTPLDIEVSIDKYEEQWGAMPYGYQITIKNNEVINEINEVLKETERGHETIKAPKLYIKTATPLTRGDHMAGVVTYENGYTVVDIKSVWEGKTIEQQQSYSFKLSGDAPIESIELVQRMSDNGPEMYRQNIYGDNEVVNKAPVFVNLKDVTIELNQTFDALLNVEAIDAEDGDLTSKITVFGSVDTSVAGEYLLTYKVSDSQGLETVKQITVTVLKAKENQAPVIKGANDVTIFINDSFDIYRGVSAFDEEDGDITSLIKVAGQVDTSKAGSYPLTYSVTDSKGLTTSVKRVVKVVEKDNNAPTLYGLKDIEITLGDKFDAMANITAKDIEDGDLTNKIVVEGRVDVNTVGVYKLTYSVEDSKGLKTTQSINVTVKDINTDTFDANKIYYGGEIVTYKGSEYKAKWWTQGQTPDTSAAWEKIVKPNEDGSLNWYSGMVCTGGMQVTYNGNTYEAKWWTTSTPGSDDSWKLIK